MTTVMSEKHLRFFDCWEFGIPRLRLLQMADLVLYTTRNLTLEELSHFRQMRSITVKLFVNSGFQSGAIQALAVNSTLVDKSKNGNAELHATKSFENIVRSRRFVWVKGGFPEHYAICRIQGGRSPVLHHHQLDQFCAKGANYFQHGFNLSMTMERQQPLENRDCKPAFIDNDRVGKCV
ncbi:unnamed protein product [Cladocopium goreaui]|uniref:DUF5672 domain-containing protein n=1 Tax=Cladocopium goreaui TaxID=2562237 RepID=A0A9P1D1R6_9DINO|nr:unnamed protein product [Cladocopium goreaui]